MATRNISTKITIDGEAEYKASVSRVNAELKNLYSALRLTESQFQSNANSMEALSAKGTALQNLYDAQKSKITALETVLQSARRAQEEFASTAADCAAKIKTNEQALDGADEKTRKAAESWAKYYAQAQQASTALENLKKSSGDSSEEQQKLEEKLAKAQAAMERLAARTGGAAEQFGKLIVENGNLNQEMQRAQNGVDEVGKKINRWSADLNDAQIKLNNLDAELQQNGKYMQEAKSSADGCATSIDQFGEKVDETAESLEGMGAMLASEQLAAYAEKIKAALSDCAQAAMTFEVGMAGVKRTTGISGEALDELGNYFKELATTIPITTQELTAIATTAGQLGIKGKENVQSFTEVMARLATTTDLSAESAATLLAQFSNITGVKDYERMGSVVASLGDATATTASKVVEMSQGIAATGTLAGMSATDIMAISAAVGSLGMESASGATAMSTLISTLYKATQTGKNLESFASVAGMSAAQFKTAWGQDAAGALNAFISGLTDTERNGREAIVILDELGITNVRQSRAILGLASAEGLLSSTLEQASAAWEQNTALSEKASVMYDTLQAKMTQMESASNNLKIAVGEALAPALGDLADLGKDSLEGITGFIEKHPDLTTALATTAAGIVGVTTAIASAKAAYKALDFLGMAEPLKALAKSAEAAGGGLSGIGAALGSLAGPAALAAAAIITLTALIKEANEIRVSGYIGDGHEVEEYADNVVQLRDEMEATRAVSAELAASGLGVGFAYAQTDKATIALMHAEEELAAAEEKAAQAAEEAAEGTETLSDAEIEAQTVAEEITAAMHEVIDAYQTSRAECRKALDSQISMFDDFAAKISEDTDSAAKMLDKWTAQTENLAKYTENLHKAAEYGLDEGLIQSFADGSAESAGYLAVMLAEIENAENGLTDFAASGQEAVDKLNEGFAQTQKAKDELANVMAEIETGFTDALTALEQSAEEANFDGFADALKEALAEKNDELAQAGTEAGKAVGDGVVSGAAAAMLPGMEGATNDGVDAVIAALEGQASALYAAGFSASSNVVSGFNDGMGGLGGGFTFPALPSIPGHATGLDYVPYDNYIARLHEGEMVLTRAQAQDYRQEQRGGAKTVNLTVYAQELTEPQINELARVLNEKLGEAV